MFVALILHRGNISCGYDLFVKDRTMEQVSMYPKKHLKAGATWNNIRIKFNYDFLNGNIYDEKMCRSQGQNITYSGETYTCTQKDILNQNQIDTLIQTFENVRTYLHRLLKVMPYQYAIQTKDYSDVFKYPQKKSFSDIDLLMNIVARPMGEQGRVYAWASGYQRDEYYRPFQGIVAVNPLFVPSDVQSEKTWNNKFFYVYVHEIFHVLGVSRSYYSYYHPYESRTPYSQTTCSFTKYGKKFTFLTTPYAHKFAKKRYGVETFIGDDGSCPAGIELEDHGDSGTAGSHLEERVFNSELMVGMTIATENGPFSRLTDASLAILQDTGNYKCDYTMAQPLVWGHPESVNGQPIHNFALGPPITTFPLDYFVDFTQPKNRIQTGGFDFSFHGTNLPYKIPNNSYYTQSKSFFNPKNAERVGNYMFDYMPFVYPNKVCPEGKATINSDQGAYSNVDVCGTYTCDGYKSFTINIPNGRGGTKAITCTSSNAEQWGSFSYLYGTFNYRCPKPEQFCRSVKLHAAYFTEDPFDPDTRVLEPRPKPPPTQTPTKTPIPPPTMTPIPKPPNKPDEKPTPVKEEAKPEQPTQEPFIIVQKSYVPKKNPDDANGAKSSRNNFLIIGGFAIVAVVIIVVSAIVIYKMLRGSPGDNGEDPDAEILETAEKDFNV